VLACDRRHGPARVEVTGFKQPTAEEREHDFLWRVHAHAPGLGNVAIFNRSHYEDVLVVRVHKLAPEEVWKRATISSMSGKSSSPSRTTPSS